MNQLFYDIFDKIPRQGPGNFASTQKAYSQVKGLDENSQILDIGCGPGQQTIDLAKISPASIVAVDNYQKNLDRLRERAEEEGLSSRIRLVNGDMFALDFDHPFELIWAEGSIFVIGFEKGIQSWYPLLKSGGYMAVSELNWIRHDPPASIREFWNREYPDMMHYDNQIELVAQHGYELQHYFVLPPEAWWDNYYHPLEIILAHKRNQFSHNVRALELIDNIQTEINMFKKYADYYSYTFYILRKS